MSVPDVIEPVVGWRAWVVELGPVLVSMNGTTWRPRERFEAECHRSHVPPDEKCTCGAYAAASLERLAEMEYGRYDLDAVARAVVVGEVNLWGGLIEGEWAHRAQFAYPRKLYVPTELWPLAKPLRERYGVPVKVTNTFTLLRRSVGE